MSKNNWIAEFNKVERKAYDMTYELGGRLEKIYNEEYGDEFYNLCINTLIETKYNNKSFNNIDEKFLYLISRFNVIASIRKEKDRFNKVINNLKQEMILNDLKINEMIINNVLRKCNSIEKNKFLNRKKLLETRLVKQLDSYLNLFLKAIANNEQEVVDELNKYVKDFTEKYENKKIDKLRELEKITIEKCKYNKIFSYKKMKKLAESKGFKHKRTTGDHMMYEHIKTKQLIPIPAHDLGYGLMKEIQKEIREKSVA